MSEPVQTPAVEISEPSAPRPDRTLRSIFSYLLQVLVVMALLVHFVGRVTVVQGASMEPGIVSGERIIVNLLSYTIRPPRRGDVVVFKNPRDTSKDYIKRVVGLPQEEIEIRDGETFINGEKLEEPYVTLTDRTDVPRLRISRECIWVMGDNRANSEDSRRWGQLPLLLVRGRACLVMWPPERVALLP